MGNSPLFFYLGSFSATEIPPKVFLTRLYLSVDTRVASPCASDAPADNTDQLLGGGIDEGTAAVALAGVLAAVGQAGADHAVGNAVAGRGVGVVALSVTHNWHGNLYR